MLILTLFEHQFLPYSALGLSATDPLCAAVDRLNAAAGREILQAGRTGLGVQPDLRFTRAGSPSIRRVLAIDPPGARPVRILLLYPQPARAARSAGWGD